MPAPGMDTGRVQGADANLVHWRWMLLARGRCRSDVALFASRRPAALIASIAGLTAYGVNERTFAPENL